MENQSFESLKNNYLNSIKQFAPPKTYQINPQVNSYIQQIPVYHQKHDNLCGFHVLNNVMNFQSTDTSKLLDEDKQPFKYPRFMHNYLKLRKFLIREFPMNQKEITTFMPFERIYLERIMQMKQEFQELNKKEMVMLMYGFNYIQNSEEELKKLSEKIIQIKNGEIQQLFIGLGITIHWTVMVIRREPNIKIYYMDSMNYPVKDILQEKYTQFDPKYKDYKLQISYFKDLRKVMQIVVDLLTTNKNVDVIKFEGQLGQMLDNFDLFSMTEDRVRQWIKEQYPIPVIQNDILSLYKRIDPCSIDENLSKRFLNWALVMKDYNIMETSSIQEALANANKNNANI